MRGHTRSTQRVVAAHINMNGLEQAIFQEKEIGVVFLKNLAISIAIFHIKARGNALG